jgi:hydrogenase maturation protease
MAEPPAVLIAGLGYLFQRDHSVGPAVVTALREQAWPPGVEVEDLSFGPIAVVQRFQDRPDHFGRVVLISAVARGRAPGGIYCYCWDGRLPSPEEIQSRVGEALMGVIDLDNLLIVGGQFRIWPPEVLVVEVEPCDVEWGADFSPAVRAALQPLLAMIRALALGEIAGLGTSPLDPAAGPARVEGKG